MTNKNKKIAIVGLIAAIYAVVTLALGFISYGQIQFRISEILMFLPLFGKEYIVHSSFNTRMFFSKCSRTIWSS